MRFSMPVYPGEGVWCAQPTARFLQILHQSGQESARWIVVVGGIAIALGDPMLEAGRAAVYVPQWILDLGTLDATGNGEETTFECIPSESLARATRLGFRVVGDLPEDIDVRELLEGALSQLGVLSLGQMIPVPAFDNCVLVVEVCEPAERVFLDGAEIALEIERAAAPAPAAASASAPLPLTLQEPFPTAVIPEMVAPAQGNRLGGAPTGRSRLIM